MTKQNAGKKFDALREFFSGYLHQDFRDEYGSARGAARAFRGDASKEEIAATVAEWQRWRGELHKSSLEEVQKAVWELGAAWRPESMEDLEALGEALNGKRSDAEPS